MITKKAEWIQKELGVGCHPALEGEEDQICAAADTELVEQVRNVKLHGALRNIELVGDFFV